MVPIDHYIPVLRNIAQHVPSPNRRLPFGSGIAFGIRFGMVAVIDDKTAILLHIQGPDDTSLNSVTSLDDLFPGYVRSNCKARALREVIGRYTSAIRFSKRRDRSRPAILQANFFLTGVIVGKRHGVVNPSAIYFTAPHNPG